jgi:hypothetical protein
VHIALELTPAASIVARAEETAAQGVVVNTGAEPVTVDLVELSAPSLALEVVDERGRPLRMLPPPMPGHPDAVVLAPGERRAVRFDAFLPARTPPGRYRVRFRYGRAQSGWIEVEIGGRSEAEDRSNSER